LAVNRDPAELGLHQKYNAFQFTVVFTFAQKKEGFFLNFGSTAVSFLLALCLAHMGVTLAID
jgi:hypothetical protein